MTGTGKDLEVDRVVGTTTSVPGVMTAARGMHLCYVSAVFIYL